MAIAVKFGVEIEEPTIAHCSILLDGDIWDEKQLRDKIASGKYHMSRADTIPNAKKTIGKIIYYSIVEASEFKAEVKTIKAVLAEKKAVDKAIKEREKRESKKGKK